MLQLPNVHKESRFIRLLIIALVFLALCLESISPVNAQSGGSVAIILTNPPEEETFYAGPTSLVYSIPINGQVTGIRGDPSVLVIKLEIFQGTQLSASYSTNPQKDGSFSFQATVNPEGSIGDFPPGLVEANCEGCHHRGKVDLPSGHLLLRVTAEAPGIRVTAERHITVDRSSYLTVPVRVVLAEHPEQLVAGVQVNASAWLYLWRARSTMGKTGPNGIADMSQVEVLTEAPTTYFFRAEPTVVDGVLYESVQPVQITLQPGATSALPVTLQVRGRTGKISGSVKGVSVSSLTVRAILLPSGKSYSTQTSSSAFEFPNIPIGSYLIAADNYALAQQGFSSATQTVDLAKTPSANVTIATVPTNRGVELRGSVRDTKNELLPFSWVSIEKAGIVQRTTPYPNSYTMQGLPTESTLMVGYAPGYYAQAQVVDLSASSVVSADWVMVRRPETQSIPWGTGEIVIPPESQVSIANQQITLDYGWLWGNGSDAQPRTIRVANAEIVLPQGRFAIEYIPDNAAWLYMLDGQANVRSNRTNELLHVRAGEMVAFTDQVHWSAVSIDSAVIATLEPTIALPVAPIWEPTPGAQLRDRLAQIGIGTAQAITFATYSAIVLLLIGLPGLAVYWWRHKITHLGDTKSSSRKM